MREDNLLYLSRKILSSISHSILILLRNILHTKQDESDASPNNLMKPKGKLLILATAYQLLSKITERHIPGFFMIYIREEHFGDHLVRIQADGILDGESIPVLDNVCQRHLKEKKEVQLCLQGLVHVSREGRDFLKRIKTRIAIINPPWLMPLE